MQSNPGILQYLGIWGGLVMPVLLAVLVWESLIPLTCKYFYHLDFSALGTGVVSG